MLLSVAIASEGALTFRDLWDAPIPETLSIVRALGYILGERARAADEAARKLRSLFGGR